MNTALHGLVERTVEAEAADTHEAHLGANPTPPQGEREDRDPGNLVALAALYDFARKRGGNLEQSAVKHIAESLGWAPHELDNAAPEHLTVPDCAKPVRRWG